MMSMGRTKHLPHFGAYLQMRTDERPADREEQAILVAGCIGVPFVTFAVAAALMSFMPSWASVFLGGLVGVPLGVAVLVAFGRWRARMATPEQVRIREVYRAIAKFSEAVGRRKLHRELDPVAAQLLEACANYWLLIRSTVNGPFWTSETMSAPYRTLRKEVLIAADQAMDEAMLLCEPCMGAPRKTKSDDLKEVFEDFAELDFEDALKGLKRLARSDTEDYAHRSPYMQSVYEPVRDIAEKLKLLSAEVEQMSHKAATEAKFAGGLTEGSAILESVLGSISAIKKAEAELDAHQDMRS